MNLLNRLAAVGVLLLAPAVFAASSFQGRVNMTITSDKGDAHTLSYEMKGQMMRIEMEGAPMSTIMDLANRRMTLLMHQQHMYMTHQMPATSPSGPDHAAMEGQEHSGGERNMDSMRDMPDIRSTGRTDKILGYTCNEFIITDRDHGDTTELWLAPDLGIFMGLGGGNPFGGPSPAASKWEQAFKGKAGFPLRVVTHDKRGKLTMQMEVTKIDRGGVSDSDFLPPAGYRQFQMPNMNPFGGG